MDKQFLQSKSIEIKELKSLEPGSKQYKQKFTKLKVQMVQPIFKDFNQSSKGEEAYPYKTKHRLFIALCIIFIVTAFVLLGFSISSLGGKEPQDFTSAEMQEFIIWMVSVFISLCIGMFFAIRSGRVVSQYQTLVIDNYEDEIKKD